MTFPRIFLAVALLLFGAIGVVALVKKKKQPAQTAQIAVQLAPVAQKPIEIDLATLKPQAVIVAPKPQEVQQVAMATNSVQQTEVVLPEADKVELLFQKNSPLPIVETIQYQSRVNWKRGRAAWLVDYASHYKTHLHFIARSLNGKRDYTPKSARDGDFFTILAPDVDFHFHLVIDISRCKLWLYYVMPQEEEYALLKSYSCGLGRLDPKRTSGSLTPIGTYKLGSRIAVYQPKMMGTHKGSKVEMIRVFGTRWIPFEKEIGECSEPAKGYGIHGTPYVFDQQKNQLVDNSESIGKYESDGCIRLKTDDIEEIFAIISTHDTIVEIVQDFSQVKLPGKEKQI